MSYGDLLAQESEGDNEGDLGNAELGLLDAGRSMALGTANQGLGLAAQGGARLLGFSPSDSSALGGLLGGAMDPAPRTTWGAAALNALDAPMEYAANTPVVKGIADPATQGLLRGAGRNSWRPAASTPGSR